MNGCAFSPSIEDAITAANPLKAELVKYSGEPLLNCQSHSLLSLILTE
jgi:hypothetical protein